VGTLAAVPSNSGSKWHSLTIERIITNTAYTGVTYFGRTTREGGRLKQTPSDKWIALKDVAPRVICTELFDRAQKVSGCQKSFIGLDRSMTTFSRGVSDVATAIVH